ncbi:unnamed protein product [Gadus morhua 'NCC']
MAMFKRGGSESHFLTSPLVEILVSRALCCALTRYERGMRPQDFPRRSSTSAVFPKAPLEAELSPAMWS